MHPPPTNPTEEEMLTDAGFSTTLAGMDVEVDGAGEMEAIGQ